MRTRCEHQRDHARPHAGQASSSASSGLRCFRARRDPGVAALDGVGGRRFESPSEGLHKSPAYGHIVLPAGPTISRRLAGTRRVHFGTGGHSRARATSRDTAYDTRETLDRDRRLEEKLLQTECPRCLRWRDADHLLALERSSLGILTRWSSAALSKAVIRLRRIEGSNPSPSAHPDGWAGPVFARRHGRSRESHQSIHGSP